MMPWLTMASRSKEFFSAFLGRSCLGNIPTIRKASQRLCFNLDAEANPVHAVWGIPRGYSACRAGDRLQARPRPLGSHVYAKGASMTAKKKIKLIHEGRFAAEVEVDLMDDETGWAPYLSVADARKLDAVRFALKAGRITEASALTRDCELHPVSQRESA